MRILKADRRNLRVLKKMVSYNREMDWVEGNVNDPDNRSTPVKHVRQRAGNQFFLAEFWNARERQEDWQRFRHEAHDRTKYIYDRGRTISSSRFQKWLGYIDKITEVTEDLTLWWNKALKLEFFRKDLHFYRHPPVAIHRWSISLEECRLGHPILIGRYHYSHETRNRELLLMALKHKQREQDAERQRLVSAEN